MKMMKGILYACVGLMNVALANTNVPNLDGEFLKIHSFTLRLKT